MNSNDGESSESLLGAIVLFEPLPVGRMGVRRSDDEVVVASDFSTFAWMLEEFVAHGVTTIAVPKSAPEHNTLNQMPALLRRRVKIVDDTAERFSTTRIMDPIVSELDSSWKKDRSSRRGRELKAVAQGLEHAVYSLALGLNHGLQVSLNREWLSTCIRTLQDVLRDSEARAVLSTMAGVAASYRTVQMDALQIRADSPAALISVFDQLVNDSAYLTYSRSVATLVRASGRRGVLARIRAVVRDLVASKSSQAIVGGVSTVIDVASGKPVSKVASLFPSLAFRSLPVIVDMSGARSRAVRRWIELGADVAPVNRSGRTMADPDIEWLPPMKSASASGRAGMVSMGTAGELGRALQELDAARRRMP